MGTAKDGTRVAVKKLKKSDGDETYLKREVENLRLCAHENVIKLVEVCTNPREEIFLVFEYCEYDLKTILAETPLDTPLVKNFLRQLLRGLQHIHSKELIHRDLKPPNIMINRLGVLKIIDLGSSRKLKQEGSMTPDMVTLRYRAPEIFLGAKRYSSAVDMWSAGCIFAEMITGSPLLDGTSELEQIDKMCTLLGSPTKATWPGFDKLPHAQELVFPYQPRNTVRTQIKTLTDHAFDLLCKLLTYDPVRRITAEAAVEHPYFTEEPLPAEIGALPDLDIVAASPKGRAGF